MLRIDFFRKRRLFFGNPLEEGVQNFYWVLTTILAEEGVSQKNLSLSLSLFSSLSIPFPPIYLMSFPLHSASHSHCPTLSLSLSLSLSLYIPFSLTLFLFIPPPFFHPPLSLFSLSLSLYISPTHLFTHLFPIILLYSFSHMFSLHLHFPLFVSHSVSRVSPIPSFLHFPFTILFCFVPVPFSNPLSHPFLSHICSLSLPHLLPFLFSNSNCVCSSVN